MGGDIRLSPSLLLALFAGGLAVPALRRGSAIAATFAAYVATQHIVGWTAPDTRAFFQISTAVAAIVLLAFVASRSARSLTPIWREPTFFIGVAPLIPAIAASHLPLANLAQLLLA